MWADVLQAMGHVVAGVVTAMLCWAALFFVGPVACLVLVVVRVAGLPTPPGAAWLFAGTAGAWVAAFLVALAVPRLRSAWWRRPAAPRARATSTGGARASEPRRPRRGWTWAPRFATAGPRSVYEDPAFWRQRLDPRILEAAVRAARARAQAGAGGPQASSRPGAGATGAGSSHERRHAPPPPPPPPPPAPPPEPDPHQVLGVRRGASEDEVRRAYRDLVKQYHPDRVGDLPAEFREVAHRKTIEIRKAYERIRKRKP